jgi:hypothetical protein
MYQRERQEDLVVMVRAYDALMTCAWLECEREAYKPAFDGTLCKGHNIVATTTAATRALVDAFGKAAAVESHERGLGEARRWLAEND